jgi:hypothetical protein
MGPTIERHWFIDYIYFIEEEEYPPTVSAFDNWDDRLDLPCYGNVLLQSRELPELDPERKYGCRIVCAPPSSAGRDHPFVKEENPIPLNEWLFLYENLSETKIFDQDVNIMSASLFNKTFYVIESIITKLIALGSA